MNILLIDDHTSFCEGLQAAMSAVATGYVVEFMANAELMPTTLVDMADHDLFIMDIMMPNMDGLELLRILNATGNRTPVMFLSSVQDPELIEDVFRLGALGFMPKSYSVHQIIEAIEQCRAGQPHIPDFLAHMAERIEAATRNSARAFQVSHEGSGQERRPEAPGPANLTRRQLEIITLMDKGLGNQEIADILHISKATVKSHVNQLFRLFEVNNRISCLRAVKRAGLYSSSLF